MLQITLMLLYVYKERTDNLDVLHIAKQFISCNEWTKVQNPRRHCMVNTISVINAHGHMLTAEG